MSKTEVEVLKRAEAFRNTEAVQRVLRDCERMPHAALIGYIKYFVVDWYAKGWEDAVASKASRENQSPSSGGLS